MKIEELLESGDQTAQLVKTALNVLMESPYFYKTDDERTFLVLMRYRQAFAAFFEKFFGWTLVMDAKCARLYKPKWFNESITPPNRDMFGFTKRDECIAFLLLLEFFERECREQGVTADDRDNLRFRFGDWLEHAAVRFRELHPSKRETYTDEKVRQILRGIMPAMEKYRFLAKVKPSADEAKPVVDGLALFLDRFGRRFHRSGPSGAAHGVDVRTRHLSGRRRDEAFRSLGEGVRGLSRTRRLCSVLPK